MDLLNTTNDQEVKSILGNLVSTIEAQGFHIEDVAHVFLVDPSDTSAVLTQFLGYSPLINRWSGVSYNQPGFTPYWEYFVEHHNWYELVCVLSDDGFGHSVLFPKSIIDPEVHQLCVTHSTKE